MQVFKTKADLSGMCHRKNLMFCSKYIRVETQYLVPAIRQFSSEVECPANGLLMFFSVRSGKEQYNLPENVKHFMKK